METNEPQPEQSKPSFRISAAVVKQLGEELVSDEVTALMELVKNSYDADAKYIIIEINSKDEYRGDNTLFKKPNEELAKPPKGFVRIIDNGFGMSYQEVFKNWLTISMSDKRQAKKSGITTDDGRTFLGEKGVGRLSTQRIGDRIDLITRSEKVTPEKTHIAFDWNDFREDITLDSVEILEFHEILPQIKSGTEILIQNLKNPSVWDGSSFDKIRGQLSQLISPGSHQGFKVFLKHNDKSIDLQDLNSEIREHAISTFKFTVVENKITITGSISLRKLLGNKKLDQEYYTKLIEPDNGKNFFDFLSSPELNKAEYLTRVVYSGENNILFTFTQEIEIATLEKPALIVDESIPNNSESKSLKADNIDEVEGVKYKIAYPGDFEGALFEFRLDKFLVTDTLNNEGSLKDIIKNQTGVRIFRDGFGIKPYGMERNDWLRFGSASTSGGSIYSLRPNNVIGYVLLTAKENAELKEKTDREGFMESPYTHNFFLFMEEIKESINTVLEKTRRSYNRYKEYIGKENLGIQDISESFEALNDAATKSKEIKEEAEKLIVRYNKISNQIKLAENQNSNLKSISPQYAEIIDETKIILDESREMFGKINSLISSTQNLENFVSYFQPLMESLESQLIEFTSLASLGITAEALSHELSNITDKLYDATNKVITKSKNKIPKELDFLNLYHEKVNTSIIAFRKQLSHLDPSLKYTREKKEMIIVDNLIDELKEYYDDKFDGKIKINVSNKQQPFSIYANKGKLFQVFDNLFINSEYWLDTKKSFDHSFKPVININIELPFIRFSDNGSGIDASIENTLFQPFITKRGDKGRGLGLFIVQQLLDSMGCTINLLPTRNAENRRHIFQINLNPIINR